MNALESIFWFFAGYAQKAYDYFYTLYVVNYASVLEGMLIACFMALLIMFIELRYTGWQASSLRRVFVAPTRSTVTDIAFFFIHISLAVTLLAILFSFGVPQLIGKLVKTSLHLDWGADMNPFLHLVLYLVLLDFFNYWQHRLMHMIPFLWHIHAFHHSASEFNTITVFREHPLDKALNSITSIIPAVLLSVPVGEYPVFIAIYSIVGYFKHSGIPWRLGWFGTYIIQSPVDHWIHHSVEQRHYDTNFANTFAIWDHVFGTYYRGDAVNTRIGLDTEPYNRHGLWHDFWLPQKRVMRHGWNLLRHRTNALELNPRVSVADSRSA